MSGTVLVVFPKQKFPTFLPQYNHVWENLTNPLPSASCFLPFQGLWATVCPLLSLSGRRYSAAPKASTNQVGEFRIGLLRKSHEKLNSGCQFPKNPCVFTMWRHMHRREWNIQGQVIVTLLCVVLCYIIMYINWQKWSAVLKCNHLSEYLNYFFLL